MVKAGGLPTVASKRKPTSLVVYHLAQLVTTLGARGGAVMRITNNYRFGAFSGHYLTALPACIACIVATTLALVSVLTMRQKLIVLIGKLFACLLARQYAVSALRLACLVCLLVSAIVKYLYLCVIA